MKRKFTTRDLVVTLYAYAVTLILMVALCELLMYVFDITPGNPDTNSGAMMVGVIGIVFSQLFLKFLLGVIYYRENTKRKNKFQIV